MKRLFYSKLLFLYFIVHIVFLNVGRTQNLLISRADSLHEKGKKKFQKSNFGEAAEIFLKALEIKEEILDPMDNSIRITANNLSLSLRNLGQKFKALEYRKKALSIQEKLVVNPNRRTALYYNQAGSIYAELNMIDSALHYFEKSAEIFEKLIPLNQADPSSLLGAWNNIGFCFLKIGDYEKAAKNFLEVRDVSLREGLSHLVNLSDYNMGNLNIEKANYKAAFNYYQKARDGWLGENSTQNTLWSLHASERVGISLFRQGKIQEGLDTIETVVNKVQKILGMTHPETLAKIHNYGVILKDANQLEAAEKHLIFALENRNIVGQKDANSQSSSLVELGYLYIDLKKFNIAEEYIRRALEIREKILLPSSVLIGKTYRYLAEVLIYQNKMEEALKNINKSVQILSQVQGDLPSDLKNVRINFQLANSLAIRAFIKFKESKQTKSIAVSEEALKIYILFAKVVNQLRIDQYEAKDRLALSEITKDPYENAIDICYTLFKTTKDSELLDLTFHFMELSKSLLLLDGWQKRKVVSNSGTTVFNRELILRKSVAKLKETIANTSKKEKSEILVDLKNDYNENVIKYYNHLDSIKRFAPTVFTALYNPDLINIQNVQNKLLTNDQSFVQYFVGKESIFILVADQENKILKKVKKPDNLELLISDFQFGISGYYKCSPGKRNNTLRNQTNDAYVKSALKLYELLLKPVENELKQKIVIVPDGNLAYIAFDALLTKKIEGLQGDTIDPFLIKEKQITYAHSGNFLYHRKNIKYNQSEENKVLIFAPFGENQPSSRQFDTDNPFWSFEGNYSNLDYSLYEVAAISKHFKTNTVLDQNATTKEFLDLAPEYPVVHIISHALANMNDSDFSFVLFAPSDEGSLLFSQDIYNTQLKSDLVVLSACQTSHGIMKSGEGILSLEHAFSFAGAKSSISSLWLVDDQQGSKIIEYFYENLKNGLQKDEALHKAKLRYLTDYEGYEDECAPYFWATFISYGDMDSIELD